MGFGNSEQTFWNDTHPLVKGLRDLKSEKNPSWKQIHHCHIAFNMPCLPPEIYHDRCSQFHWGEGGGGS